MKLVTLLLWLAVTPMATVLSAEDTEPKAIFNKVVAAYAAMETYSSKGTIVSDMDTAAGKMKIESSFSIKLKKPNLYLISWDQKNSMMAAFSQSGAVWNDGAQQYLYMGMAKSYSKMGNDEAALAAATGISGGAAATIPLLFLSLSTKQPAPFFRLTDPKLEGGEQVDGEDCYVIGGSSTISKKETFWISKNGYRIRKYARSLEPPEGGVAFPKISDQELEESIKALGQEVTKERKEAMKKMMQQAKELTNNANMKGTATELHTSISTPDLVKKDFAFKVPPGTALKDSLFGDLLK